MKQGVLIFLMFFSLTSKAAFEENARRYSSGQEIVNSLDMYVPMPPNCLQIPDDARSSLGLNSPLSGNPISPAPNQATIQWLSQCIATGVNFYVNAGGAEKLRNVLGPELFAKMFGEVPANSAVDTMKLVVPWSSLEKKIREEIVAQFVFSFLGSNETILDYGLTTSEKLRAQLLAALEKRNSLVVLNAFQFLILNLALRDEFLSY